MTVDIKDRMNILFSRKIFKVAKTSIWNNLKGLPVPFMHDIKELKANADLDNFIKAGTKVGGLVSFASSLQEADNTLKNYSSKRPDNSLFKDIKTADSKETIGSKLEGNSTQISEVKKALDGALKLTDPAQKVMDDFQQDLQELKRAEKSNMFSAGKIGSRLTEIKAEAKQAIIAQQTEETSKLETLFKDDTFCTNLKSSLGMNSNDDVEPIKKAMLTKLGESQKAELSKLETDLTNNINTAIKNDFYRISLEYDRMNRFATYEKKIANRPDLDAADPADLLSGAVTTLSSVNKIKGGKIEDFNTHLTTTGREIKKNADGTLHVTLNRFYQSDNSIKEDMDSLIQTLQAKGGKPIKLFAASHDPKRAEELARMLYERALKRGEDPKDVKISANGQVMDVKKLFEKEPNRLRLAEIEGAKAKSAHETAIKAAVKSLEGFNTTDVKAFLAEKRQQAATKTPAADSNAPSTPRVS